MFKPRDYQAQIINEGSEKLLALSILLLAMEVRTGKTLTALGIAQKVGAKKVVFLTKKKVVLSKTIHNDYDLISPGFEIIITNYEQVHKTDTSDVDLFIIDESHSFGAFPKPSLRTKNLKKKIGKKKVILLTGTPTPESYSQFYHQFWISDLSPFKETSFYKWSRSYVNIKKRYLAHGNTVNDYSDANISMIKAKLDKYMISYTQKQAGFTSEVKEEVLYVKMKPITYSLVERLKKDLVIEGETGVILADTPVKLMQKCHQLYSGSIKLEEGDRVLIDDSKAVFIKQRFKDNKIAIFYKFIGELELLKEVFGDDLTTDLEEFNTTDKTICLQIVSGREGISLSKADYLIMFNIDFSATSYWQSRDRMTTKERAFNKVYWIFSDNGIESQIYKAVKNKKNYTLSHFKKDF